MFLFYAKINLIKINVIITRAQLLLLKLCENRRYNETLDILNKQDFININRILENIQAEGNSSNIFQLTSS
jgi:hypothetical protein